jgi:hypothetical protein
MWHLTPPLMMPDNLTIMSNLQPRAVFVSAYRQLSPSQRAFVDAAVQSIEDAANRAKERISLALNKPIPVEIVDKSNGMLDNPLVCAAITERITAIAAEQELTAARLIKELMSISTANINNFIEFDPETELPSFTLHNATPDQMAAIKSIEVETNGNGLTRGNKSKIKLTFHEKLPAIKMLGEYIGLWSGDNPHFRAEQAKAVDRTALPQDATIEQVADEYQRYLGQ